MKKAIIFGMTSFLLIMTIAIISCEGEKDQISEKEDRVLIGDEEGEITPRPDSESFAGTYFYPEQPETYLRLKEDGTFQLEGRGIIFTGNWKIQEGNLILTFLLGQEFSIAKKDLVKTDYPELPKLREEEKEPGLIWSHRTDIRLSELMISADGSTLLAESDDDDIVCLFDRGGFGQCYPEVSDFVFAVGNGSFALRNEKGIYYFDRSGNLLWQKEGLGKISDFSISEDGSYLGVSTSDNKIYFFDRLGKLHWGYQLEEKWNPEIFLASDGSQVFVIIRDNITPPEYSKLYHFNKSGKLLESKETILVYEKEYGYITKEILLARPPKQASLKTKQEGENFFSLILQESLSGLEISVRML